jgi:solute carrier family 25 folate transporter 32
LFTSPLDVIRTRLMVQDHTAALPRYRGTFGSMRTIYLEEGIRGFYRGLTPAFMALMPNWGVYFLSYGETKRLALSHGFSDGPLTHLVSAMSGAVVTDVVTNPLWLVKTRMQAHTLGGRGAYSGVFNAFVTIVRKEGVLTLWNGLSAQLLGVVHVCVQFPLYEHLKKQLSARGDKSADNLTVWELIYSSSVSKAVASTFAYPHEVLRSRMHVARGGEGEPRADTLSALARRIWRTEGLPGFYRGLGTNLLRTVPAAAVTLTSYELFSRALRGV